LVSAYPAGAFSECRNQGRHRHGEASGGLGLALEAIEELPAFRVLFPQDLERDVALKGPVVGEERSTLLISGPPKSSERA
jgi:hypothetical protein